MPRPRESGRERREKAEKFQSFNRPKLKIARTTASGTVYIDYKDTESLKKMLSANGKILSRRRTGATAMEQRMIAQAVKRARDMSPPPARAAPAGGGGRAGGGPRGDRSARAAGPVLVPAAVRREVDVSGWRYSRREPGRPRHSQYDA